MSTFIVTVILALLTLNACTNQPQNVVEATAIPTLGVEATPRPSKTPIPTPISTSTPEPTPTPLTPADIFNNLSPAVARIEADGRFGTGVLIEDRYILTNAHVVWPATEVNVTFPDGEKHVAPVAGVDLLVDLALLGPIDTSIVPLSLTDGEQLAVGSPLLLIGYPGDVTRQPRPALTQTLVSRLREQESFGMTYLQVDSPVAGGQSGGIAVTMEGDVIGLTGHRVTEVGFGIVTSAADILPRMETMLGEPTGAFRGAKPERGNVQHKFEIADNLAHRAFVVDVPIGTLITAEVSGDGDAVLIIQDTQDIDSVISDEPYGGVEKARLTTTTGGPHFVIVRQHNKWPTTYTLKSNQTLIPYVDPDDGHTLKVGEVYQGMSDYPVDVDVYSLDMTKEQAVNINLSSMLIDPYLLVWPVALGPEGLVEDSDSGDGLFNWDAEMTYLAPNTGGHRILATDMFGRRAGGYQITIREPYADAPTPISPLPTMTPAPSPIGPLMRYESSDFPFAISYPASYDSDSDVEFCRYFSDCFMARNGQAIMGILESELTDNDGRPVTLEDLRDHLETNQIEMGLKLIGHDDLITPDDTPALLSTFEDPKTGVRTRIFTYLLEPNLMFRVVFMYQNASYEEITDYLIRTFEVIR